MRPHCHSRAGGRLDAVLHTAQGDAAGAGDGSAQISAGRRVADPAALNGVGRASNREASHAMGSGDRITELEASIIVVAQARVRIGEAVGYLVERYTGLGDQPAQGGARGLAYVGARLGLDRVAKQIATVCQKRRRPLCRVAYRPQTRRRHTAARRPRPGQRGSLKLKARPRSRPAHPVERRRRCHRWRGQASDVRCPTPCPRRPVCGDRPCWRYPVPGLRRRRPPHPRMHTLAQPSRRMVPKRPAHP